LWQIRHRICKDGRILQVYPTTFKETDEHDLCRSQEKKAEWAKGPRLKDSNLHVWIRTRGSNTVLQNSRSKSFPRAFQRDCGGNLLNYLAIYRIVMSSVVLSHTIDTRFFAIYVVWVHAYSTYLSLVLMKSCAKSLPVVRSRMDFHKTFQPTMTFFMTEASNSAYAGVYRKDGKKNWTR